MEQKNHMDINTYVHMYDKLQCFKLKNKTENLILILFKIITQHKVKTYSSVTLSSTKS